MLKPREGRFWWQPSDMTERTSTMHPAGRGNRFCSCMGMGRTAVTSADRYPVWKSTTGLLWWIPAGMAGRAAERGSSILPGSPGMRRQFWMPSGCPPRMSSAIRTAATQRSVSHLMPRRGCVRWSSTGRTSIRPGSNGRYRPRSCSATGFAGWSACVTPAHAKKPVSSAWWCTIRTWDRPNYRQSVSPRWWSPGNMMRCGSATPNRLPGRFPMQGCGLSPAAPMRSQPKSPPHLTGNCCSFCRACENLFRFLLGLRQTEADCWGGW